MKRVLDQPDRRRRRVDWGEGGLYFHVGANDCSRASPTAIHNFI